jgi:hypothetical protein
LPGFFHHLDLRFLWFQLHTYSILVLRSVDVYVCAHGCVDICDDYLTMVLSSVDLASLWNVMMTDVDGRFFGQDLDLDTMFWSYVVFCDSRQFSAKKLAFFAKTNVMINNFLRFRRKKYCFFLKN